MSKLLKSKFFLGAMAVTVMFVGVVAINASSASADCSITSTLRVGSRGEQVVCLQTALGGLTADGNFGPMTKAAVVSWQLKSGLVADGIFGPKSNAMWMANAGNAANFPSGCVSSTGFSTTTGLSCAGSGVSLPAGCSTTSGFSPTTGMSCSVTSNLPAGCSSTSGYSPTTGASCSGGSSSGGALVGGAGSLNDVQEDSSLSGEEVSEGQSDVKVAGWTITADNSSDLAVSAFKLTFEQTDTTSSDKMDDYIDSVSVWQGSTKVGSADVADFSENNNVYSKTINLTGATIKADKDSDFFVTVDATNNIDSGDLGDNTFALVLDSVRFEDATGAILTDSTTGDLPSTVNFSFETVATTTGLELKVSKTTGSAGDAVNDAHIVDVDDTSDTNNVPLLAFDIKATGDLKNIQDIPVKIDSTNTVGGSGTVTTIANGYSLWKDGVQIDSVNNGDLTTGLTNAVVCTTEATCYVHFNDVDFDMSDGSTSHFIVKADINDTQAGSFVNGNTLQATMADATEVDNIDAEDANGDAIGTGDLTGAAAAAAISFYATGIQVAFKSATATVSHVGDPNTANDSDQATFVIKFDVTAFGGDMFVDKDALEDITPTEVNQIAYKFVDGATDGNNMAAGVATLTSTGDAVGVESFRVGDTETETFTLTVVGEATTSTFVHLQLGSIGWNPTSNATAGTILYTFNLTDFKTGDVYLNDN